MTTICLHDGVLAWDSQLSFSEMKVYGEKAIRLRGGGIAAISGDVDKLPACVACLYAGGDPKTVLDEESELITISRKGIFLTTDNRTGPLTGPWAGGSGAMAAMAGIQLGLSAKEAVELAAKVDLYTGGPVKTYTIPEWKLRSKRR